jgi:hypothetical protein
MEEFLRLCLQKKKDEALEVWRTKVQAPAHALGAPEYTSVYDNRWWLWCSSFQEEAEGLEALQRLLLTQSIDYGVQQNYLETSLKHLTALPTVRRVHFEPSLGPGYLASSPCVLPNPADPEGFLVCVRHVNYRFLPNNTYPILPEYQASAEPSLRDRVRTRYHVHVCDRDLKIQTSVPLADHTSLVRYPSPVLDLEDLRLVALPSGALVGLAASREVVPSTLPQMVLCSVSLEHKELTQGTRLFPHIPEASAECQKNWLPLWNDQAKDLQAFYVMGPEAVLVRLDPLTGVSRVAKRWRTGLAPHAVRGSAPPVPWGQGEWLSVVHTSLQRPGVRRKYVHRFVLHAPDYQPVAISEQWNFSGADLDAEFVLSCCRASPTSYFLGFGQNDNASWVAEVSVDTIQSLRWFPLH